MSKRSKWGYATDDFHDTRHIGLGWCTVYVQERTSEAVCNALQAGRFYASTGVIITRIEVRDGTIYIATENADRIIAVKQGGRRVKIADEREIEVEFPEDAKFVRIECWGKGESFAWTQPFFNRAGIR